MKKFATLVAATAVAAASVSPALAQDGKVDADPFVSSQGTFGAINAGVVVAGIAVAVIAIAAIDSSDDT